jgi:hypothetical protein
MFEEEENPKWRLLSVVGLAFLFAVGMLMEILCGVLYKAWWLILIVVIFAFVPLPTFFCGRCSLDPFSQRGLHWKDWGNFFTGLLVAAGLGLPFMMVHNKIIQYQGLLMGLAGGILVCASVSLFIYIFHRKRDDI